MNAQPRICILCTVDGQFDLLLKAVRDHFPNTYVIMVVRQGVAISETERDLIDESRELDLRSFSVTRAQGLLQMLRMLRRERFDHLFVLFDSLKLRILCALSGANRCGSWREDGRMVILPTSLPATLVELGRLRAKGTWQLAQLWFAARFRPIRPRLKR